MITLMTLAQVQAIALSKSEIWQQLDILTKAARSRMQESSSMHAGVLGGAEISFMSSDEMTLRHALMLKLPSIGEERLAAQLRIKERIVSRRMRGKVAEPVQA